MNILPKKRWHVRTKENIARVRRDEAEAAEKERQENLRIENADREARLNFLKEKSKQKLIEYGITKAQEPQAQTDSPFSAGHINLFADIDSAVKTTNKEHDIEAKEKKEEYEKQIGYLTYLGQDTNEALGKKNWYEVTPGISRLQQGSGIKETYNRLVLKDDDGKPKPREVDIKNGEVGWKAKQKLDPMNSFKKYCSPDKKIKHQKLNEPICEKQKIKYSQKNNLKPDKEDKKEKLQKLREARLKREQQEKYRTEVFLTNLNNPTKTSTKTQNTSEVKQKYNSQFNPDLARQNFR